MAAAGHFLKLRLFLEGVEVPVVSASIQSGKNAAAQAAIQIPANDYALDFRPRTLVHLFAYDIYNGVPPESMVSVGAPGTRVASQADGVDPEIEALLAPDRFESTPDQDHTDLINENFKLIFGGEVVGFSFSKSPMSRSIVLQCLDWSSYWDIAYQYQVSGFSMGGGGTRAAFTGASTSVFNDFLDQSGDTVSRLMATPPRSNPELKNTLLGGVVHLIEAIGGVYFGRNAVRGTNDFFSFAEIRLHITQMVGANPYSNRDERHLLSANGFGSLFSKALAGLGKQVSVRAVLLSLQRYIFHEVIPITAPRFIPGLYDPTMPHYEKVGLAAEPATAGAYRNAVQIQRTAQRMLAAQQRCVDAASTAREGHQVTQNLRAMIRTCNRASVAARRASLRSSSALPDRLLNTEAIAKAFYISALQMAEARAAIESRAGAGVTPPGTVSPAEAEGAAAQRPSRRASYPEAGTLAFYAVVSALGQTIDNMQGVIDMKVRRRVRRTFAQPDPPPKLITQIYRPDVWMVAPPRCNVIFPELYSQFSFGRHYMAETTRLLLRTNEAFYGSDELFDGFFMSPSNMLGTRNGQPIVVAVDPDIDNVNHPLHVSKDLLDHELFSGIIPAFERMNDLNLHALRGGYTTINGAQVGYAQLACNHIFFQKRYQSRELNMQGKFNPYLALGFPMLIIDKYLPVNELENGGYSEAVAARLRDIMAEGDGLNTHPTTDVEQDRLDINYTRLNEIVGDILENRPNTHYLGTAEMISHTIDATNGGTTSVQMAYARTTNERTEFLGDNVGTRARHSRNTRTTNVVAALEAPTVGSVGPRGGTIVEGGVVDVTSEFRPHAARGTEEAITRSRTTHTATGATRYTSSRTAPLFIPDAAINTRLRQGTRVVVGVQQPAQSYGPEVVAYIGSGGATDSSTINRVRGDAQRTIGEGGSVRSASFVTFRAYRVTERIGAYTRTRVELPPETLLFPPWYGDAWRSERIGGLYAYFFGTGAITDPLVVNAGSRDSTRSNVGGTLPTDDAARRERTLSVDFTRRFGDPSYETVRSLGADDRPTPGHTAPVPTASGEVTGPARADPVEGEAAMNAEIGRIRARSPIGLATEELVRIYSRVKLNKYDVHLFVQSYTWRPIASMIDLFGSANLEIDDHGTVVRGIEGFHSRAFGDFDDLRQIIGPVDGDRPRTILGLAVDDPARSSDDAAAARSAPIAARMDTRKEKRTAVMRYLFRMKAATGILG